MLKKLPIIIVEDDLDDQDSLRDAFESLKYLNKLYFFGDGQAALDFLNNTDIQPFLILCDINMPKLNGFDLKSKLRTTRAMDLRCVPYVFFSTANSQQVVGDAYSLFVQGFFVKQNTMLELKKTIKVIMEYWERCTSPSSFTN